MKLTLGFSPCPNDTFIFDALVNKKIDTQGLGFEVLLEDVQTLNNRAINGKLDFSKISYGVLPLVLNEYVLLKSGGALGKGVGPLLIAKPGAAGHGAKNEEAQFTLSTLQSYISNATIAVPGENTTANMLFSLAFPGASNKRYLVFNQIEDAVLSGEVGAGVIIHENRFTYQQKGLIKLMDLGEYWEQQTGLPIPLGGIVARRNLRNDLIKKVDQLIRQSVEYAFSHYPHLSTYITSHAQEMNEDVMRKHIDLYVNDYSLDVSIEGKAAIQKLLEVFKYDGTQDVFVG